MKKIILKWLGFDDVSIKSLKKEISDLETTISTLKDEATVVHGKTEQAFMIIKGLKIDKENELWWENNDFHSSDPNVYIFAERIRKSAVEEWVMKHPSLKEKKIFHGGCLDCITPIEEGIGKCLGCQYMKGLGSGYPSLNRKKSNG